MLVSEPNPLQHWAWFDPGEYFGGSVPNAGTSRLTTAFRTAKAFGIRVAQ